MIKALSFAFILFLSSCASLENRQQLADSIAKPTKLKKAVIDTDKFKLATYQRIKNHDEANIYIEGDGLAWLTRTKQSLNPTPTNPVALRLAAKDSADNVIYLARPCQYISLEQEANCSPVYWASKRFAPEIIESYMNALDKLEFKKINLIGFSGGAAIATILSAKRDDINSLRTVAGNIDTDKFTSIHNISPMTGSLNPADFAGKNSNIPQIHFIGREDKIIPQAIFEGYAAHSDKTSCAQKQTVAGATHENGWEQSWPELLKIQPVCK